MANEFPKLSEVFKIGTEVTYDEAIEKVFLPQDNAVKSIPSISPIETVTLTGNKIVPTAFLVQIQIVENLSNELHFIDYTNLRDGAILQLRILDNNNPIVIKNGISGVGSIMTADGNDIELNDYRTIVQLQLEGTLWRQVGGIQAQADWNQVDSKKPDFIKNKPTNLLDSTNITNCITEIPQDIKLELNNGTVTLKAGSKVYVPNGIEDGLLKFDEVVTTQDLSATAQSLGLVEGDGLLYCMPDSSSIWVEILNESGTTNPSLPWTTYYNTSENKVYRFASSNTTSAHPSSFPIAKVSFSNSTLTSIDQVFNGFGYIGSTVFALPNVKGLIPDGRNTDGTLKNIEFTSKAVSILDMSVVVSDIRKIILNDDGSLERCFTVELSKDNYLIRDGDGIRKGFEIISHCSTDSYGKITSFNPKTTFRAFDYSDMPTITYWD